jgi:hypothetical protein
MSSRIPEVPAELGKILEQLPRMRKNEIAVIFRAQGTDPGVKDLEDLRTGLHLGFSQSGDAVHETAHQGVPGRGVFRHQLLGSDIVFRRAAFDHVAGERKRRAAEADERHFPFQFLPDDPDGIEDGGQRFLRLHRTEFFHVGGRADRTGIMVTSAASSAV